MWFDAHFHLPAAADARGVLCTSRREEWPALSPSPGIIPSAGLLPASTPFPPDAAASLIAFLDSRPKVQIGEVGLDRRFPDSAGQLRFLSAVLAYARETGRLVSLHVVHADGLMVSLLDGSFPSLWHGFTGSRETAERLRAKRCLVSLGPRVVRTRLWRDPASLKDLPFLLETDGSADPSVMASWYAAAAAHLGLGPEELEARCEASFRTLLQKNVNSPKSSGR